ncbi:MAG: hypothetical protein C4567_06005 [Deltaproteobacteria bacterium]|nr:MAG: hypothetical protein C4567_06005 [Deltaproteobacteria bacterium]
MKTRGLLIGLLAVAIFGLCFSTTALAQPAWYDCTVDQAGPMGSLSTRLFLTHAAETPVWEGSQEFFIPQDRAKEFLAVALTAIVNNKQVKVYCDLGGPRLNVRAIYLKK